MLLRQIISPPAGAPTPAAVSRLQNKKPRPPAFSRDARPLGGNRVGGFSGEVPHHLPTDGRVGIEKPFNMRGSWRAIVAHLFLIACGVSVGLPLLVVFLGTQKGNGIGV